MEKGIKAEVNVISAERLDLGTIRIMVAVNGHLFKRLFMPGYPVVWHDECAAFNSGLAMEPHQEEQLESIFKAWMMENKTDESKLLIR